jgi:hypothetical protein
MHGIAASALPQSDTPRSRCAAPRSDLKKTDLRVEATVAHNGAEDAVASVMLNNIGDGLDFIHVRIDHP